MLNSLIALCRCMHSVLDLLILVCRSLLSTVGCPQQAAKEHKKAVQPLKSCKGVLATIMATIAAHTQISKTVSMMQTPPLACLDWLAICRPRTGKRKKNAWYAIAAG